MCTPCRSSPPDTRAPFPAWLPHPLGHIAQGIFWGRESERVQRTTMTHSHLQHLPLVPSKNVFQNLLTPLTSEKLYRNICLLKHPAELPQHHELLSRPRPLSHADGWRLRGLALCVCLAQPWPGVMDRVNMGQDARQDMGPTRRSPAVPSKESRTAPVRVTRTDTAQRWPRQPIAISDV